MNPLLDKILASVEVAFGVSRQAICGPMRPQYVAEARMAYYLIATQETKIPARQVAGYVRRKRSTVNHGAKAMNDIASAYPAIASKIEHARRLFRNGMKQHPTA
ncbi:hypothetical protein H5996_10750 [Faecalicoccus pleomorphus]|nr:hypothetical protein [Faecalicoccus pleomorphus]